MSSPRWKSQENIGTSHNDKWTGHTAAISEETPAMIYDGLRCSWEMAHFIAGCGSDFIHDNVA